MLSIRIRIRRGNVRLLFRSLLFAFLLILFFFLRFYSFKPLAEGLNAREKQIPLRAIEGDALPPRLNISILVGVVLL